MFPHSDIVINRLLKDGCNEEEIIQICLDENLFSYEEVKECFDKYIEKISSREKGWDIKILDYILSNYKEKLLFYDIGHPTNDVLKYISLKILEMLNISDNGINCDFTLEEHQNPIYPSVAKLLGLKFDYTCLRKNGKKLTDNCMDFSEYIKEYIWYLSN